jgi:hypothetical protein
MQTRSRDESQRLEAERARDRRARREAARRNARRGIGRNIQDAICLVEAGQEFGAAFKARR